VDAVEVQDWVERIEGSGLPRLHLLADGVRHA
jgi:hypothetical protein